MKPRGNPLKPRGNTVKHSGNGSTRALLLALAAALCSCGWQAGLEPPVPARTIAVRFLENATPFPDLEIDMTAALTSATRDRLDLRVANPTQADLVIRGQLTDLSRSGGVRNRNNQLEEAAVDISLLAELVDADGEVLRTTTRRLRAGFVVDPGFGPAIAPGEARARSRVIRNLAEGVVLDLFGSVD